MFKDAPYMHAQCAVLHELCKTLDPGRCSACANLYPLKPKSRLNEITDLVGYNIYFGWYYGQMTDYADYLDRFHKARPMLPLGISEYGVDSNLALHSEQPHIKDYSEEYQALWHETVYPQIEAKPWLWGSFVWNMFDFSSARRNEGGVKFVNGKGLVSRDRQTKKDAFYYYKARWSDEPFVHLCGHRFQKRCRERIDVKVYTNRPSVQLWLGASCIAEGENDGNGTVLFRDVPLALGENRLGARSGELYDSLIFERVETPEESYRLPGEDGGEVKNWFLTDNYTRQGYFSVNDTANDVLDEPAARAVLEKYVPGLVKIMTEKNVIPLGLTIKSILSHDADPAEAEAITKKINAELNEIENLF
jgi:beta-galactosidase